MRLMKIMNLEENKIIYVMGIHPLDIREMQKDVVCVAKIECDLPKDGEVLMLIAKDHDEMIQAMTELGFKINHVLQESDLD